MTQNQAKFQETHIEVFKTIYPTAFFFVPGFEGPVIDGKPFGLEVGGPDHPLVFDRFQK